MPRMVGLADFRPSERFDGQPWTQVRVEEADDPAGMWSKASEATLEPIDEDPAKPGLRSVSTSVAKAWARLVFIHEEEEDAPRAAVFVDGPSFLPTISDVASILRARTYSGKHPDPENPMAVVAGGVQLGEFTTDTTPSAEEVEKRIIPSAVQDVLLEVGDVPGEFVGEARRIAAMRAGVEIERSYIPEQADETRTLYQTLRLTYKEEVEKLATRIQWWLLTNKPPVQRASIWTTPLGWWPWL
jgi:hypothetical protein